MAKKTVSKPVHCPLFWETKQEWWWVFLANLESGHIITEPRKITGLQDKEELDIVFMAPPAGRFNMTLVVVSDSYFVRFACTFVVWCACIFFCICMQATVACVLPIYAFFVSLTVHIASCGACVFFFHNRYSVRVSEFESVSNAWSLVALLLQ